MRWSSDIIREVGKQSWNTFPEVIAETIKRKYGVDITPAQVTSICKNHKFKRVSDKRLRKRNYSIEVQQYIEDHAKGTGPKLMAIELNERFGTNYTTQQIKTYYNNNGITSGTNGRFQKGHIPPNKGKKLSQETRDKIEHTWFKKGHVPLNYRPVGSTRINIYGYWEIKVREGSWGWRLLHRVLWEQANGPIPKDKRIMFLNGNKQDCRLENLALVEMGDMAMMNHRKLITSDAELTTVNLNAVRVTRKISEIKKGKRKRYATRKRRD